MAVKIAVIMMFVIAAGALTGCYQAGYVMGSGVKAVRHPIDTASRVYRY